MKQQKSLFLHSTAYLCILLLACASFAHAWTFVEGTVTDEDSQPIAGATVSTDFASVTSQADGSYDTVHPDGAFDISATAPGYGTRTHAIPENPAPNPFLQNFTLPPAPVTIDSVSPNWGEINQQMPTTIKGSGFDESSRVSMYLDGLNNKALLASHTSDYTTDMTVVGSLAYVVDNSLGLFIFDITDPANPVRLGSCTSMGPCDTLVSALGVSVAGDFAYVADGVFGLQIINVSDPNTPFPIQTVTTSNAQGVTVAGNFAYVADYDDGLQIIDVTNPATPVKRGAYDTSGQSRKIWIKDSLAYIADGPSGLLIVDVSNPDSPVLLGSCDTLHSAYDVEIMGDIAYIADGESGLLIIDVTDPTAPVLLGTCDTPGFAHGLSVAGSITYIADKYYGLQIIDTTDPAQPVLIGACDTPGTAQEVMVKGTTAYVADSNSGLMIFDISNPLPFVTIGMLDTDQAVSIQVVGNLAFIADYVHDSCLKIIDISNPSNPILSGFSTHTAACKARDISVAGSFAYLATESSGLEIFDVSAPDNPQWVATYDTGWNASGVTVVNNVAYVTGDFGLKLIDVTVPGTPVLLGEDSQVQGEKVTVSNSYAYVTARTSGLKIYNVNDTSSPSLVGTYNTSDFAYDVSVVDNIAYVADSFHGLKIIDVSNPAAPQWLGSKATPGLTSGVTVVNSIAYVADGGFGIQVIDVNHPESPILLGTLDTVGSANDVTVQGNLAFVADGENGLAIVPLIQTPSRPDPGGDTENEMTVILPATELAGNYTIQVFNAHSEAALPGALTLSTAKTSSKAIIVAGYGPDAGNWLWDETYLNANFAYKALKWQGYTDEDISYLSSVDVDLDGDGSSEVDGDATSANLQAAIAALAGSADDVVIYLVDHGGQGTFHIKRSGSTSDILAASDLAEWLNNLQDTMTGRLVLVYEGCYSGTFVEALKNPAGKNYKRIVMTSATADEKSKLLNDGSLSFSYQFWASIFDNADLIRSFNRGYDMMHESQTAWLDANGDGNPNQSNDMIADNIIGRGYKSAPGIPLITSASPIQDIGSSATTALLWATLDSLNPVSRVWAVMVPPDYDRSSADTAMTELPSVQLAWSESNSRWENSWDGFTANGPYMISFFAEDNQGSISLPYATRVIHSVSADGFEPDNTPDQARPIVLNKLDGLPHTIHAAGDEDWSVFYGQAGVAYNIKVGSPGPKMDAIIELYNSAGQLLQTKNTIGALPGAEELMSWTGCSENGLYYIRIRHASPLASGIGNSYELTLTNPTASDFARFPIVGVISSGGNSLGGAILTAVCSDIADYPATTAITNSDGSYELQLPVGTYIVSVQADGYDQPQPYTLTVNETSNENLNLAMAVNIPVYPPVANAGPNQVVTRCDTVTLDGTGSSDTDGSITAWDWQLDFEGDTDNNKSASGETVSITDLVPGTYHVTLIVEDNDMAIDDDAMELYVAPAWGEANGDCQMGLEEVIRNLQVITGQTTP